MKHRNKPVSIAATEEPFTKIPNRALDNMAALSEAELRIYLAVARKTIGWHKESDIISRSQFEQLTGLARRSVQNGIARLLEKGILTRTEAGKSFAYQLATTYPDRPADLATTYADDGLPSRHTKERKEIAPRSSAAATKETRIGTSIEAPPDAQRAADAPACDEPLVSAVAARVRRPEPAELPW